MAEGDVSRPFYPVSNIFRFALVAFGTGLLVLYAESLDPRVTGSAGLGLLHVSHGEMFSVLYIENCVMADLAVLLVFRKVQIVAENNRIGIFEGERDIFGFFCRHDKRQRKDENKCYDEATRFHM